MINYEDLEKIVKSSLSEYRYEHSKRVVERAIEYAKAYNIDINKVKLTAIAHDIAKEYNDEQNDKFNSLFDEYELINKSLRHAKIASIICKEYGFDEDMLNAIKYHTTGRENMSILEKIIYLADATEQNRNFGSNIVELVKNDIDKAMVVISSFTLKKLLESEKIIHIDSIKCYNYYNILCSKKGIEHV